MASGDRERLPATLGTVRSWKADKGWGVITPDGSSERVWTHFSHVEMQGYTALKPGERVWLIAERPGQDSYPLRAVVVRQLDPDGRPIVVEPAPDPPESAAAFASQLTIRWRDGTVERSSGDQPLPGERDTP